MRNAANDTLDWLILLVWVIAVSVIVIAANNPDFSDYITELKHGAYDFFDENF